MKSSCNGIHHFYNITNEDYLKCKGCGIILTRQDLVLAGSDTKTLLNI